MEKRMFQQQSVLFLIIQMIVYLLSVGTFINNPYCQILENSSRNFSEISAFRVMSQTVLIRSGKLIQNRAFRQKNINLRIPERDSVRIYGNLIQSFLKYRFWGVHRLAGKLIHVIFMITYSVKHQVMS